MCHYKNNYLVSTCIVLNTMEREVSKICKLLIDKIKNVDA